MASDRQPHSRSCRRTAAQHSASTSGALRPSERQHASAAVEATLSQFGVGRAAAQSRARGSDGSSSDAVALTRRARRRPRGGGRAARSPHSRGAAAAGGESTPLPAARRSPQR
eukprot:3583420-Prymnesium_polylepis.1